MTQTTLHDAFQDHMHDNYCFGCGILNEQGLKIKSHWEGDEAVCVWTPKPEHAAGPRHILNGGIIATVIDCHCICTALANSYRVADRPMSANAEDWFVTGILNVKYLKPTPIDQAIELRATVTEVKEKKTVIACTLSSQGEICVEAEVIAIRVPPAWSEG
jgi:acyl-coenzyme A thioesterase PaaI-like protein